MKKLVAVFGLCVFCILAGVVMDANTPEISAQTAYQKLMNKYILETMRKRGIPCCYPLKRLEKDVSNT